MGFPDYKNRKHIANGYTVTENGYISASVRASVARYVNISVNSVNVARMYCPPSNSGTESVFYPPISVEKGDVVNIDADFSSAGGQGYSTSILFYPMKY